MENKANNRRKFNRFFVSPRLQLRYGSYYSIVAASVLAIWGAVSIYFMISVLNFDPKAAKGMTIVDFITTNLTQHQWMFAGAIVLSAILFLALAMILTERIAGAQFALLRHVEALNNGNYEFKTTLRKADELKPLMKALNNLSVTLKERHGDSHSLVSRTGTEN